MDTRRTWASVSCSSRAAPAAGGREQSASKWAEPNTAGTPIVSVYAAAAEERVGAGPRVDEPLERRIAHERLIDERDEHALSGRRP